MNGPCYYYYSNMLIWGAVTASYAVMNGPAQPTRFPSTPYCTTCLVDRQ
jgi:hypothetical protein